MRKCKHPSWEVIGNDYVPGDDRDIEHIKAEDAKAWIAIMDYRDRLLLGTTTLTQRCNKCHWVETKIVTGKVVGV